MPHYRLHKDPRSSHQQIARLLEQLRPKLILDVGAAQGILGQVLAGKGLVLDAIEPRQDWAAAAKPYYRQVYATTVEGACLPPRSYDAVVCADVLEHLPDPLVVLKQLRAAATDDATFIISLPNVTHLAVRMMLLAGHFPKMERGILDRTHLQFFTRDTAEEMLAAAGLKVMRVSATGVPLDELWKNGDDRAVYKVMAKMQHAAVRLWPRMFGFQWVFVAKPANA